MGLFLLGFLTFIPLIQDICLFGIAALIGDLVLQQMFFVPILASNMARTAKPPNPRGHKKNLSASKPITWMQKQLDSQSPTKVFSRPSAIPDTPVKAAKRLRLFYFVFDHRLIHMLMGLIFVGWMVYLSVISSEGALKFGSTGINETQLPDDRLASNHPPAEEKPTFEKHKFIKNKFRFSHFLSPQHWSTLFWSYNVSLSGTCQIDKLAQSTRRLAQSLPQKITSNQVFSPRTTTPQNRQIHHHPPATTTKRFDRTGASDQDPPSVRAGPADLPAVSVSKELTIRR